MWNLKKATSQLSLEKKINVVKFFHDFLSLNELWRVLGWVNSFLRNGFSGTQNREERGKLNALSNKKWFVCRIRSWFKERHILLIQENVLFTQNIRVRHMKYFLQASEVTLFATNPQRVGSLTELQRLECQKSTWKSLFFDKTCIVRHTVMIQRALHSPDLGKCFTYSRHLGMTHE